MTLIEGLEYFQKHGKRIAHNAYAGDPASRHVMNAYRRHFHNPHDQHAKSAFMSALIYYMRQETEYGR